MSKGTARRAVRVDDELWMAALSTAAQQGESLSEVIRQALRDYIREGEGSKPY